MAIFASNLAPASTDRALGDAKIQRSLRFNDNDSAYLYTTPSSAGNRQTWTISAWVKRSNVTTGTYPTIFSSNNSGNYGAYGTYLWFYTTDELGLSIGSGTYYLKTNAKFRDTTSWYHVVAHIDTTQGTSSDRVKLYVNGEQQTDFANATYPTQNYNTEINNTVQHTVGARRYSSIDNYFDGYLAEINFIDGYAYDPSYFGFTDSQTGIWMPKRYEGTYGTNGFYFDFSDNSSTASLGIDKSPNGNDWTTSNFSVSAGVGNDSVTDTPTNNFATLNPLSLSAAGGTFTNGNLDFTADGNYATRTGNISLKTGKWYWEVIITNIGTDVHGIVQGTHPNGNIYPGYDPNGNVKGIGWYHASGGLLYGSVPDGNTNGGTIGDGNTALSDYTTNDVLGFASDIENGTLAFYKNGSLEYTLTGIGSHDWFPAVCGYGAASTKTINFGQLKTTSTTYSDAKGHGSFKYSVPSGFLAMCSANLSPNVPSIVRPQKHFDTVLYTGDEATSRKISGLEFQPDLVWIKPRSTTSNHCLLDSVRGVHNRILPNSSNPNVNNTSTITAFNVDGFQIGNSSLLNTNSATHVAWCWKAGGNSNTFNIDGVGYATAAAAGLDEGTANPTGASVNTEAGFSIVQFEAQTTNTNITLSHGLGKKPEFWMWKSVDNNINWYNYHHDLGYNAWLNNSTSDAATTGNDAAWKAEPTSTVFTHGSGLMNQDTIIMYMWTSIPGYSKFGSYKGNGSSDGIYVHLGFKPAFLMVKKTSGANSWVIYDVKRSTSNVIDNYLIAEGADVDNTNSAASVDLLSNGFKFYSGYDIVNAGDYIYMAFAEQPGVTPFDTFSNAR